MSFSKAGQYRQLAVLPCFGLRVVQKRHSRYNGGDDTLTTGGQ